MALDPSDFTVDELKDELEGIDAVEAVEEILADEEDGKERTTAIEALERRLRQLKEAAEEAAEAATGEDGDESGADDGAEDGDDEDEEDELSHPTADKRHVRALEDGTYGDMWVYCETQHGELIDVSKEMLGKAAELMEGYNEDYGRDEKVVSVVIGDDAADLAEETIGYGADVAVYHEDDRLERFLHEPYTEIVADMARWTDPDWRSYDEPRYVIFPATNNGRDLSAQVQAELDSGLASDCNELFIEDHEETNPMKTGERGETKLFEAVLHMKRPDFSGFEWSTILCLDNPEREFHPQGASVIPGSFPLPEHDADRDGTVEQHDLELPDDWFDVTIEDHDALDEGVDLTGHDVVVAIGRGIGDDPTRGIELALDLVDAFDDAALGLSRGIVTASYDLDASVEEYASEERQIGETGQEVEPEIYIAAGISGAVQHKVGMDESDTIITVNTDDDARIKDFSDYFIVGDLFEVLPQLTEAVEEGELPEAVATDGGGGA